MGTCIILELIKQKPSGKVIGWLVKEDEEDFLSTVIALGEVYEGIKKLQESKKRCYIIGWQMALKNGFGIGLLALICGLQ